MKSKLILLLCILAFNTNLHAQSYRTDAAKNVTSQPRKKKRTKEKVFNPNIIKLNVPGLLMKSVGLQFEHRITRKTTLAMGLIYRPMGSWTYSKYFDTLTTGSGYSQETIFMFANSTFRTFMLTPEFKYFLGRRAPAGIYVSAFARAKFDKTNFKYHYQNNSSPENLGSASLNETVLGGGLLIGYQIMSKKHLTIDFWFLGPWIGNMHTNLRSSVDVSQMSSLQQTFASQGIKEWFSAGHEVEWNSKGIATRFNELFISTRIFGINLGYSFK